MKRPLAVLVLGLAFSARLDAGACSPSTFVSAVRLATPYQPLAVATGDLDGDGHLDLVSVNYNDEVTVFLGAGDGSFGPPIDSASVYNASSFVALGQFDAGSTLDLAIGNYSGTIVVLLGNGDGTFAPPVAYASGNYPSGLVAADLTGDGDLDLIEGVSQPAGLSVLVGNGDGTFGAPVFYPLSASPVGVAAGNFDNDGDLDVAVTLTSNAVAVFPGTGGGALGPPSTLKVGPELGAIVSADLNGDGDLDLAIAVGNYLGVLRGNGDGTFRAAVEYPSSFHLSSLGVADLDGDGRLDVVGLRANSYSGLAGIVVPFLQEPDGSFEGGVAYLAGQGSVSLALGDFDEDGLPDAASADFGGQALSVLFGEGVGRFRAPTFVPLTVSPRILVPGDFDGDAHADLAVLGDYYDLRIITVLDHVVSSGAPVVLDSQPEGAAAADFDGNGSLDLVITTYNQGLKVLFGNGDGTFQPSVTYFPSGYGGRWVVTGDFTGDGMPDVAFSEIGSTSQPEIALFINDGLGNLTPGATLPTVHHLSGLVAARFDAGPTLDLAATNGDCCQPPVDTLLLMRGNGDGTFQPPVEYPTGPHPSGLAVGDFTGDDAPDLAIADANATNVSVLINDLNGGFEAPVLVAIGWSPLGVAVADFNIDGKSDIATVNANAANVSLLLGTGDGGFQAPVTYPAPSSGFALVAVSFGGQGPDLAIAAPGDAALEILFNANLSVQTLFAHTVLVGSAAQFVGSASGVGPLTSQWLRNGTPLTDGGSISGAQTPILTIDPASFADGAAYSVTVSDACGSVTSNAVQLYVEFADVSPSSPFHDDIIAIATAGITGGCGGADYCPVAPVRRDQMAAFLLKAEHGAAYTPPACTGVFADAPCPGPFTDWIEQLAAEGVTGGCGGGNYCPDASVTRAQMAVFLLKTLLGSAYTPPAATGIFGDVPIGSFAADFIEDLYNRGITGGCSASPLLYCPGNAVLRQQMATFLVRTFFP